MAAFVHGPTAAVTPSLGTRPWPGEGACVEAYNPCVSSWAFEEARSHRGHRTLSGLRDGTKTLSGAGSRLTPKLTKTASSRWPFHARIDPRCVTLTGTGLRIRWSGVRIPSGRATF